MRGVLVGLSSATVILCVFFFSWPLSSLDWSFYDYVVRVFWAHDAAPEEIVIVAIDSRSLQALGAWPWPRSTHAEAIEQLTQDGAKAIYLDVGIFDPDRANPASDRRLVEATAAAGDVFYPMTFEEIEDDGAKRLVPLEPLPELAAAAAGTVHAHLGIGADGVARAVHLAYRTNERTYWGPSVEILRHYLGLPADAIEPRGTSVVRIGDFLVPVGVDTLTPSREWRGPRVEYEMNIGFFGGASAFASTPVVDLLEGRFPQGSFDGKMVLYGPTAVELGDAQPTPLSRMSRTSPVSGVSRVDLMPGIVIQAHALATILSRRFVRKASPGWIAAVTLLAALAWGWAAQRRPLRGSAWSLLALVVALVLAHLCLMVGFRLWLPVTPIVAAVALTQLALAVSRLRPQVGEAT